MTSEQIASCYEGLCKVVDNINAGKPDIMTQSSWDMHKSINMEWLRGIVKADFWTDEDLTDANTLIG
jgi:hypothetical protein